METLFYDIKQQYKPPITNYINYAPYIKILLHKYFYSNNNYLLNIISCIRSECEVTDVIYNHNNRTFVMKISKGKMTKVNKEIKRMNNANSNGVIYTVNDYFYEAISMAFHNFFLSIQDDFENTLNIMPDVNNENAPLIKEAFLTLIQFPTLITNITQIISITESDNCIIIDV